MNPRRALAPILAATAAVFLTLLSSAPAARAQPPLFSIDFQGPTAAAGAVGPGDILAPGPGIIIPAGWLGAVPSPWIGKPEVDALADCGPTIAPGLQLVIDFTVDEFAAGIVGAPFPPNVTSEGAVGNREASADIYRWTSGVGVTGVYDGNGIAPFPAPGLGLVERNPPTVARLPDRGDNVDALMYDNPWARRVYFSLDESWVDPLEVFPANSGTAAANLVAGCDILVIVPGAGVPAVFATCAQLGLGPTDDVDALILHESGNGTFDPSTMPYDWNGPPPLTDLLLFSVRRGSPIIGTLDSLLGLPIEEGDILTVMNRGTTAPGIFVTAETLGLRTVRGGYTLPFSYADDLDGMSLPFADPGTLPRACEPYLP